MKKNLKIFITIITILCIIMVIAGSTFAHSGRTDSNGGHKDNQNKSGLGSYHYHCGGYPPHLHENGVCPYSSNSTTSSSSSSSSSNSSSSTSSSESTINQSSSGSTSSSSTSSSSGSTSITTSSPSTTIKEETIIRAESIEIKENITNMKVGETKKLTANITPTNTTDKDIIWKSSNEDIATVSTTGKIVALEAGTVRITASTDNGKIDEIEIIIEEEVQEEKKENNTVVMPIINDEIRNTTTNETTDTTENSDTFSGIIGLGIIGGGSYWGYKIYKKFKK